jgi:hypothetical protein
VFHVKHSTEGENDMNPETNPVTVDTPYGKLYVAVISATEDVHYQSGEGRVVDVSPRVRVATDPTFEADPGHADHWTIRRRAYAVHKTLYFRDLTHIEYSNGNNGGRWQAEESPYKGGFRNDRRAQVEYGTKTWDMMRDAVHDALDKFAAAHPGWEDFSRYLLLKGKHDRRISEAVDLRVQADKEQAEAEKLAGEMAPVFDAVPASLRALIRS